MVRALLLCLVACLVATTAASPARAAALDDEPLFVEGQRRYDKMSLDPALEAFQALLTSSGRTNDERARLHLWIGLTQAELGDFAAAQQSFERGFALQPQAKLPIEASPKVMKLVDDARAASFPPPAATTTPSGPPTAGAAPSGTAAPPATGPSLTAGPAAPSGAPAAASTAPGASAPGTGEAPPAATSSFPLLLVSGLTITTLGVLGVGAGVGAGWLAMTTRERAVAAPDGKTAKAAVAEAGMEALAANVLYIAGGAVAAIGLVAAVIGLVPAPTEA